METLLFLSHRLPYPPNKGDKVRSYHLLRHLAQRYRIVLGTFIDDPLDWQHVEKVRRLCAEVHVEAIVPWRRRVRSVAAVLTGEALTLHYFRSRTTAPVGAGRRAARAHRARVRFLIAHGAVRARCAGRTDAGRFRRHGFREVGRLRATPVLAGFGGLSARSTAAPRFRKGRCRAGRGEPVRHA